ncbi:MAG: hypothetical protein HYX78_10030 [Armatimonadetes bacterium]|nr:hypothetical protein [Armatimonadota bacterium]
MKFRLCFALVLLAIVSASQVLAIEIIEGPIARSVGDDRVVVGWMTDEPSDTLLEYGPEWTFGMSHYDPNPTTMHTVQIINPPGMVVYFQAMSMGITGAVWAMDWYASPDQQLADITVPFEYETVVTGPTVQITAGLNDVYVPSNLVEFQVVRLQDGQQVFAATDNDGTQWMLNTEGPEIDGDGWSSYWDTTGNPAGEYVLIAVMHTDIGPVHTQRRVFFDAGNLVISINSPLHGDFVSGNNQITVGGGGGAVRVNFQQNGPVQADITFPTTGFKQTDYPVDGANGTKACDPTAQASIFWSQKSVQDKYKSDPRCANATDKEACAKGLLVKDIAAKKKTDSGGTGSGNSKSGTKSMIKRLDLTGWQFYSFGQCDYKKLKKEASKKGAKGVLVHVAWPGKSLGHAMALKSISDKKKKKGNKTVYEVTFTDPASGTDITVDMNENGTFEYPPGSGKTVYIRSGGTYVDLNAPGSPRLESAGTTDWVPIGTDDNPADGFSINWDTTSLTPGLYWIRATSEDADGHTWTEDVEVAVSASATQASEVKTMPDGTPLSLDNKVVTGFFGDSFWIEDENRASGIRVSATGDTLSAGNRVSVEGFMVTEGLERAIAASGLQIISTGMENLKPLGMNNRAVGGGDSGVYPLGQLGVTYGFGLNNVGLYITTWGRVLSTGSDPDLGPYAIISDGSPGSPTALNIRVYTSEPVMSGDFFVVSGAVGLYRDRFSCLIGGPCNGGAIYAY